MKAFKSLLLLDSHIWLRKAVVGQNCSCQVARVGDAFVINVNY